MEIDEIKKQAYERACEHFHSNSSENGAADIINPISDTYNDTNIGINNEPI